MGLENWKIIDSDKLKEADISTFFFYGGEPHAKVPVLEGNVLLHLKMRTLAETVFGALLIDAFSRQNSVEQLAIFAPYWPAARQDKVKDNRASLTLDVISRLFVDRKNPLLINVFDVHSPISFDYARLHNFMPTDLALPPRENVAGIIAPDAGAKARAALFLGTFYPGHNYLQCEKERNPTTGEILRFNLPALEQEGHYIIVDDICDGGATFNQLAQAFNEDPAAKNSTLELFVSHGIFSKGLDNIDPKISKITTTNSWTKLESNDRLTVVPLEPLFDKIINEESYSWRG